MIKNHQFLLNLFKITVNLLKCQKSFKTIEKW